MFEKLKQQEIYRIWLISICMSMMYILKISHVNSTHMDLYAFSDQLNEIQKNVSCKNNL